MSVLATTTHRATVHALTRSAGDLTTGTVVDPFTGDGLLPAEGAVWVEDATGRGAYVAHDAVQLVTGYAVLIEHVDGYTTVLRAEDAARAETMGAALDAARGAMPAVASVSAVEIIRQH